MGECTRRKTVGVSAAARTPHCSGKCTESLFWRVREGIFSENPPPASSSRRFASCAGGKNAVQSMRKFILPEDVDAKDGREVSGVCSGAGKAAQACHGLHGTHCHCLRGGAVQVCPGYAAGKGQRTGQREYPQERQSSHRAGHGRAQGHRSSLRGGHCGGRRKPRITGHRAGERAAAGGNQRVSGRRRDFRGADAGRPRV